MAAKKTNITVLLADDQTLFREGIKDLLDGEKGIEVVGEAVDGKDVMRMAKKLKPNVILMDIKLPHMDGISATRQLRQDLPATNILILSSFEDEAHVLEAIQAGANGYLSKMLPASELVRALKTFATEGMMQTLAEELKDTSNVRVNCINPGATRTQMRASAYPAEEPASVCPPEAIMPLYNFLMGSDSAGVTGQSLDAQKK